VSVVNCCVAGNVTVTASSYNGRVYAGGLVGYSGYGHVAIENSYTTSAITVIAYGTIPVCAGGLIGYVWIGDLSVKNSYTTGDITASSSVGAYAGDLIGLSDVDVVVENCYRLSTQKIIGGTINEAGKPLTPEEMKIQQSFIDWDFEAIWAINHKINEGYPHLLSIESMFVSEGSSFGSFWLVVSLLVVVVVVCSCCLWLLKKR
jgi:hypothetical protein